MKEAFQPRPGEFYLSRITGGIYEFLFGAINKTTGPQEEKLMVVYKSCFPQREVYYCREFLDFQKNFTKKKE